MLGKRPTNWATSPALCTYILDILQGYKKDNQTAVLWMKDQIVINMVICHTIIF